MFGRWKVIKKLTSIERKEAGIKDKHPHYLCECECGNRKIVRGTYLENGESQSCGCLQKELASERMKKMKYRANQPQDLTGKEFGFLEVIEKDTERSAQEQRSYWFCRCKCGTIKSIAANNLLMKRTMSCGCNKKSHGELTIAKLLNDNNIGFQEQYTVNIQGHPLRFDFYVNNSYFIEFDGEQHYKPMGFNNGIEKFEKLQEYDKLKNEYCQQNNLKLIRIPYTKLNTLTIEDLLT